MGQLNNGAGDFGHVGAVRFFKVFRARGVVGKLMDYRVNRPAGEVKLVKTDEGGDRIEIGVFNGTPMIKLFQDGVLGLRIQAEDISGDSVGTMRLYGPDVMEIGETYQCVLTGWGIYFGSDATAGWATALQLPDASKFGCSYIPEPLIGWDLTNNKLKVKAGGTIYTFSPD